MFGANARSGSSRKRSLSTAAFIKRKGTLASRIATGLFGLTTAYRAARTLGLRVLIIERRSHIGGNAMSAVDPDTGIEVHCYGSHLFHCNSKEVWTFINQFGAFSDYRHHVFTNYGGKI